MKGDVEETAARGPGMRATREAIAEMRDERAVVTIQRRDVASVTLRRGIAAERPVLEGLVGFAMIGAGALGMFMHGPITRGVGTFAVGSGFLAAMGLVLLVRVLRVCDLVDMALQNGSRRKLAFSAAQTSEQRRMFAHELRALGWLVTVETGG